MLRDNKVTLICKIDSRVRIGLKFYRYEFEFQKVMRPNTLQLKQTAKDTILSKIYKYIQTYNRNISL